MLELLIGTANRGKLREYREILGEMPLHLRDLNEAGLGQMDIDETGDTFEANSILKAQAYAQASGLYALADDSGLMIDALGGLPGLYSHRYAGPDANDDDRVAKVLRELDGVPDAERTARFVCVTTLANPTTLEAVSTTGIVEGHIGYVPDTSGGGFGYDPVFIPEGYSVALSAISVEEKNSLSHRGRAAEAMRPILQRLIEETRGG